MHLAYQFSAHLSLRAQAVTGPRTSLLSQAGKYWKSLKIIAEFNADRRSWDNPGKPEGRSCLRLSLWRTSKNAGLLPLPQGIARCAPFSSPPLCYW